LEPREALLGAVAWLLPEVVGLVLCVTAVPLPSCLWC
jgi:hypothetical protein